MKELLQVRVLSAELPSTPWATVWVFSGEVVGGPMDGLAITFAVDHRMAHDLAAAVGEQERVMVGLEQWQVLS